VAIPSVPTQKAPLHFFPRFSQYLRIKSLIV